MTRHSHLNTTLAAWSRLGVIFGSTTAPKTPDLEPLLVTTAITARRHVRLFIAAASWLALYGECVAKRRLSQVVADSLPVEHRPVLGFMLSWVQRQHRRHARRFAETIELCAPATSPAPFALADAGNPALWPAIRASASPLSRSWGLWLEPFDLRHEILRPPEWIAEKNPAIAVRALTGGDLMATILATAKSHEQVLQSESALAEFIGAARPTLRDALWRLRLAGLLREEKHGRSNRLRLN